MSDAVSPEDFQAILAQLRDWVRTKVVPREREIADADAIPDDLRKQAADMGLFGYAIPQEWGGLGLDLRQDVELAMELGYTSLAVRSMFGTNNGIAGQVLVNFGTDEQKAAWLGRLASGAVVASFALTEPGPASTRPGCRPAPSGRRRRRRRRLGHRRPEAVHHQRAVGRPVRGVRPHPARRRVGDRHRGVPGAGGHGRGRGRGEGQEDGPGGRLDLGRVLLRRPGARRRRSSAATPTPATGPR